MGGIVDVRTLEEAPVVGQRYRVPCVRVNVGSYRWVPVLGPLHRDPEIGGDAAEPHWHYDWRFISDREGERVSVLFASYGVAFGMGTLASRPTHSPALRVRECFRVMPTFPAVGPKGDPVKFHWTVYAGCYGKRIDPSNPVCPHRGFSLRGLPQDEEGCVVCPGHGLRWSMRTGELMVRPELCGGAVQKGLGI